MKKSNHLNNRKHVVLLLTILSLFLTACGKKADVKVVELTNVKNEMQKAAESLPKMSLISGKDENAKKNIVYLTNIDYEKIEDYFFLYAQLGADNTITANEIAVILLKDEADSEDVVKDLKSYVESRVALFKQYQPEEVERAEKALVFKEGRYAVMIMCDEQDAVKDAFEKAIHE